MVRITTKWPRWYSRLFSSSSTTPLSNSSDSSAFETRCPETKGCAWQHCYGDECQTRRCFDEEGKGYWQWLKWVLKCAGSERIRWVTESQSRVSSHPIPSTSLSSSSGPEIATDNSHSHPFHDRPSPGYPYGRWVFGQLIFGPSFPTPRNLARPTPSSSSPSSLPQNFSYPPPSIPCPPALTAYPRPNRTRDYEMQDNWQEMDRFDFIALMICLSLFIVLFAVVPVLFWWCGEEGEEKGEEEGEEGDELGGTERETEGDEDEDEEWECEGDISHLPLGICVFCGTKGRLIPTTPSATTTGTNTPDMDPDRQYGDAAVGALYSVGGGGD
ncbi:hypothetical protein GQ43DRAFT_428542 [Delitschia confertaspora ATCC 74209]|uniref:Uncharacterized protein n=1 Tax=Delitschia confertaspora ATCC 74209 TaxID=1513339 RepID=A0A9P4JSK2_9PLEO|nr:hypothetical protein GQ43DRAFT_428542 [Delitschia confertaspora ATCC 74209]